MKKFLIPIMGLLTIPVYGQNIVDATRFASQNLTGTARYRSMGGAFGALGGDPSAMSDNPAGIGVYRGTSILSFTPNLSFAHSKVNGSATTDNKRSDLNLANLSYILSMKVDGDRLVNFNIGVGFNHKEGLKRKYQLILNNPHSRFGRYLENRANNALLADGKYYNFVENNYMPESLFNDNGDLYGEVWGNGDMPLTALYAWETKYLKDYWEVNKDDPSREDLNGVSSYERRFNIADAYQRLFVVENNRNDEYNLNLSANWADRIYGGVTFTINDMNSTIESDMNEDYFEGYNGDFIRMCNQLETKGTGFGIKAGVIGRITDTWRVGLAAHTPTWYKMTDYYCISECNTYLSPDDDKPFEAYGVPNDKARYIKTFDYEYRYQSPWQLQLSTAWVLGRKGLISLEADMVDYTTQKYKNSDDGWDGNDGEMDMLKKVSEKYCRTQLTYKAGGEYRVTDNFSVRLGYAFKTSPFKDELYDNPGMSRGSSTGDYYDENRLLFDSSSKPNYSILGTQQYISAGLGWSGDWWTIDFSFMDRIMNEKIAAFPTTDALMDDKGDWFMTDDSNFAVKATHCDMKTRVLTWDITVGLKF